MENQYRGGSPKKRGLDSLQIYGGGLDKKGGGVFEEGGLISQCTLCAVSLEKGMQVPGKGNYKFLPKIFPNLGCLEWCTH